MLFDFGRFLQKQVFVLMKTEEWQWNGKNCGEKCLITASKISIVWTFGEPFELLILLVSSWLGMEESLYFYYQWWHSIYLMEGLFKNRLSNYLQILKINVVNILLWNELLPLITWFKLLILNKFLANPFAGFF